MRIASEMRSRRFGIRNDRLTRGHDGTSVAGPSAEGGGRGSAGAPLTLPSSTAPPPGTRSWDSGRK